MLVLGYAALYCTPLPAPPTPRALPESTKILDRQGRLLYDSAGPADARYSYLPLKEIPQRLRQAVIATEDASFYDNPGIDLRGIARAGLTDLRHGELRSGGSTITQQLARNLYFEPDEALPLSLRDPLNVHKGRFYIGLRLEDYVATAGQVGKGYSPFGHTDMRDNRVALFARFVAKGVYEYTYFARATTPGEFRLPPATASEQFFPEVWGAATVGSSRSAAEE